MRTLPESNWTLGHDQRGALFAEYAAVLIVVSLVIALALAGLGIPLSSLYAYTEFVLGLPIP